MKRLLLLPILCLHFSLMAQWVQTNGPASGSIFELYEVNDELWATPEYGLYVSGDEGETWASADFLPLESKVNSVLVNGDEILVAIAVADLQYDPFFDETWSYFFYHSMDAGATWAISELELDLWPFQELHLDLYRIGDALFHTVNGRLFRSIDDGVSWSQVETPISFSSSDNDGAYLMISNTNYSYLSDDLGESWELVSNFLSQKGSWIVNDRLYVLSNNEDLYVSEDMGANWEEVLLPGYTHVTRLVKGGSGNLYLTGLQLFVSEDNGDSWTQVENNSGHNPITTRDVSELDNGSWLVGSRHGIFNVTDNGNSWLRSDEGMTGTAIFDLIGLSNGEVLAETDLGYFKTSDNGESWTNLGFLFDYWWDSFLTKGDSLLIFSDGDIQLSTDNLNTLDTIASTSISFCENFKYANGRYFIFGSPAHYYSDDLVNWNEFAIGDPSSSLSEYIDDLFSPADGVLLASSLDGGIYRSTDNGLSWEKQYEIFAPGTSKSYFHSMNDRTYLVYRLSWHYSEDDGLTWTELDMDGLPDGEFSTMVAFADNNIFANYTVHGVYASTDGGTSWTPHNEGQEATVANAILAHNGKVFLGSAGLGVWRMDETSGVSLFSNEPIQKLTVFPNPTSAACYLQVEEEWQGEGTVKVFDVLGRLVLNEQRMFLGEAVEVDLHRVEAGFYFLEVEVNGAIFGARVVVE